MQSFESSLKNINKVLENIKVSLKNEIEKKLESITIETTKENFGKIKKVKMFLKKKFYDHIISSYKNLSEDIQNLKDLYSLGKEEKNDEIIKDCEIRLDESFKEIKKIEVACFLSGESDALDIYLEVHAGAGGTESQDWAEMLRRMYIKWFDKKNYSYEVISEHRGEEAGIKSSTLKVSGLNLYGLMKNESGVHRLVESLLLIVEQEDIQASPAFGFILLLMMI